MRFLKWRFVKVRQSKSVWLRITNSRISIWNTPLWISNLWGLKRTGTYTVLCRYVSQKGFKSCTTWYLSFVWQDAFKITLKNTLKAGLYKGFRAFIKSAFCHATSNKKSLFCRATSYKIGTNLEIRGRLILCDTAHLLKLVCMPSTTRDTAIFDL